ncbi:LapA family protein [Parenemella sanctibonifatiensis]|uniref:Lipopolysaccharide assembly protein A domain-containing protein n=1 Tax=Parenemella sanctibonifatiensis TaxID=2016505 RepID=A0A255EF66_9ACTN|nr:lipopolysaccharide assembly protein LapA domain-containing protein [Parenemella sanctibonifatiensis]OYN88062.1 hypothetical protein CGZ92_05455 [Parenemella sanctibonifatiensis]
MATSPQQPSAGKPETTSLGSSSPQTGTTPPAPGSTPQPESAPEPRKQRSDQGTVGPSKEQPPVQTGYSLSAATWVALIIGMLLLILLLTFIVQNNVPAQFTFITLHFELPLGVATLLAAILGALIMAVAGTIRMLVLQRRYKNNAKADKKRR